MSIYKLLKRFLHDPNIVGFSLVRKKVYIKAPATIPNELGEAEVIGEPKPFFLQPRGCSPDFETQVEGAYLTAQHCIGIDNTGSNPVTLMDGSMAAVLKANPWQPLTLWSLIECMIKYFFTKKWDCINIDWALITRGNSNSANPVGALSGGTEPPGLTFFAPYVSNPEEWVGKQICGVSYDYDNNVYVQNTWDIADLGIVRYNIEGNVYPVLAWYARGFSKPGFSGTNAFPPSSCPQVQVKTIEARDSLVKDKA